MALLQDAEVLPSGEHRVGVGLAGGGGGDDTVYVGLPAFVWTRHGVVGDLLELRFRVVPVPLGASVGLKGALAGAAGEPGFHLAVSADAGAYVYFRGLNFTRHSLRVFDDFGDRQCGGDHGCESTTDPAYAIVEGAVALGHRASRDLSFWVTPRVAHAVSLVNDFEQTVVAASVGVAGGRSWLVGLELTPGYDVRAGVMMWYFAIGLEFPLGGR